MWKHIETDELYHYGIPGMKWGVRRAKKQLSSLTGRNISGITDEQAADFKREVKIARKRGLDADFELDTKTGELTIKQWYNSKNQKIGKEYAEAILAQAAHNSKMM